MVFDEKGRVNFMKKEKDIVEGVIYEMKMREDYLIMVIISDCGKKVSVKITGMLIDLCLSYLNIKKRVIVSGNFSEHIDGYFQVTDINAGSMI